MIGESAAKEIAKIPLSDNSGSRRIDDMLVDILAQLQQKLLESKVFALQLGESTDVQVKTQLPANVRYLEGESMRENFLFCHEILTQTTGEEIFNVTAIFLRNKNCNVRTV